MSTNVDLLGSTSSGRALVVPQFSASDGGGTDYGPSWNWYHRRSIDLSTSTTSVQISNPVNVAIGGSVKVDFDVNVWCFIGGNEYRGRTLATDTSVALSGFVPSTTTSNGMIFLNGGTAAGSKPEYKSEFSPTGDYQDCDLDRAGRVRAAHHFSVPTNTDRLYDSWILGQRASGSLV